ncbi:hypothetical protein VTL71DRAFT_13694 [Oculimacula yallundae]|uniref:Uncharacterized protein n=1 Tax=Oculimacula yallundae TaxID=86028 RepID=A0ABR4CL48_9HELO
MSLLNDHGPEVSNASEKVSQDPEKELPVPLSEFTGDLEKSSPAPKSQSLQSISKELLVWIFVSQCVLLNAYVLSKAVLYYYHMPTYNGHWRTWTFTSVHTAFATARIFFQIRELRSHEANRASESASLTKPDLNFTLIFLATFNGAMIAIWFIAIALRHYCQHKPIFWRDYALIQLAVTSLMTIGILSAHYYEEYRYKMEKKKRADEGYYDKDEDDKDDVDYEFDGEDEDYDEDEDEEEDHDEEELREEIKGLEYEQEEYREEMRRRAAVEDEAGRQTNREEKKLWNGDIEEKLGSFWA